jgi:hypothetical protein
MLEVDQGLLRHAYQPRPACAAVKYRYVITNEGTVEADTPEEAETNAFAALEFGSGIFVCEVEPLPGEARE